MDSENVVYVEWLCPGRSVKILGVIFIGLDNQKITKR